MTGGTYGSAPNLAGGTITGGTVSFRLPGVSAPISVIPSPTTPSVYTPATFTRLTLTGTNGNWTALFGSLPGRGTVCCDGETQYVVGYGRFSAISGGSTVTGFALGLSGPSLLPLQVGRIPRDGFGLGFRFTLGNEVQTVVPEPGTGALAVLGLLAIGGLGAFRSAGRRRRAGAGRRR